MQQHAVQDDASIPTFLAGPWQHQSMGGLYEHLSMLIGACHHPSRGSVKYLSHTNFINLPWGRICQVLSHTNFITQRCQQDEFSHPGD
jgi:hypothetical protein